MAEKLGKLCSSCKGLFESEGFARKPFGVLHHSSVDSLRDALQLPCSMCSLLWDKTSPSHFGSSFETWADLQLLGLEDDVKHRQYGYQIVFKRKDTSPADSKSKVSCLAVTPLFQAACFLAKPPDAREIDIISRNTGSRQAIQMLQDNFHRCQASHPKCRKHLIRKKKLPDRLIHVGETKNDHVRLCDSGNIEDTQSYMTLSHCWGTLRPFCLTRETLPRLQAGIPVDTLPKTFQDAIYVARKLQVRYLWIDSMCIFQDNIEDWSVQASAMGDVYSQAVCNIAATSATNGSGGLFRERDPEHLNSFQFHIGRPGGQQALRWTTRPPGQLPFGLYRCDRYGDWTNCIENAPLNHRAWVCQERHLSSRILHFAENQLYWECRELKASEVYPDGLPAYSLPHRNNDPSLLKECASNLFLQSEPQGQGQLGSSEYPSRSISYHISHSTMFAWGVFRILYTSCDMSKEEDKLVAIMGVAKNLSSFTGDELVVGLWRSQILEELCWFVKMGTNLPPLTQWRAPTWSWASLNEEIRPSTILQSHGRHEQRNTLIDLVKVDVNQKKSGQVISATLQVKCKLIEACIGEYPHDVEANEPIVLGWLELGDSCERIKIGIQGGIGRIGFCFDDRNIANPWPWTKVALMIVQQCLHDKPDSNFVSDTSEDYPSENFDWNDKSVVEGLVLAPTKRSESEYKRVGLFTAEHGVPLVLLDEWASSKERTISII